MVNVSVVGVQDRVVVWVKSGLHVLVLIGRCRDFCMKWNA